MGDTATGGGKTLGYYYNRFRRFLNNGSIPVTKRLALLSGLVFILPYLLSWFYPLSINSQLGLNPFEFIRFPWTLVTYPLVNDNFMTLIFALLWLWFVGGGLERSWGSFTYGLFFILATLVTGTSMALSAKLLAISIPIQGLWLPLVGVTWAWAAIDPDREILFWGIIPLKALWLAWITAGYTFFTHLPYHLILGLASISSIVIVYLFLGKGPFARGYRHWAWTHNFSLRGWLENRRRKARKSKFKVIK
jgi:membrane associated rhomboid family serine protease